MKGADALLPDMAADILLADKAFDADGRVIEPLRARGKSFVIPPKSNRKVQRDFDRDAYKARHLIDIDQSWRLSRLLCEWGGGGASRRPSPPRHRGREDGLQGLDLRRIGMDEFGTRGTDFEDAAA